MDRRNITQDQAAAHRTALDLLAQLIGYAAGVLEAEDAKANPDPDTVAVWRRRRDEWAQRRRTLAPHDHDAVRSEDDGGTLRSVLDAGQ